MTSNAKRATAAWGMRFGVRVRSGWRDAKRYAAPRCLYAALLMASLFLTAGCMTGSECKRPVAVVPEQWSVARADGEADGPKPDTEWWKSFQDPILDSLMARGFEGNLDLRVMQSRVREARAARGGAASALWPFLNLSGGYARTQSPTPQNEPGGSSLTATGSLGPTGFTPTFTLRGDSFTVSRSGLGENAVTNLTVTTAGQSGIDRQSDLFRAGFDARWELDLFGGTRRSIEAAEADVQAVRERLRASALSLAAEIAANYIELRAAQNRLDVTQRTLEALARMETIMQDRFQAGLTSELDVVTAHAHWASTQAQLPVFHTQITAAIHRLALLLGHEPGALKTELSIPAPLPTAPDAVPIGLPSDLLRRRPDIRQAERQVVAATARVGVAMAELFPKFTLTAGLSGQSATLGSLASGANRMWSFGPGISWPIFRGGEIRANIETQNARQEQAAIVYEQTILAALGDVENSLAAFANEQTRIDSLRASVETHERAFRIANERYLHGLEGYLSVLQAQQNLYAAQDQLIQSQGFALTDLVSLYKSLGGGWEKAVPEPE